VTYAEAREFYGRQLESGYLTPTEHRRIIRALDRAETVNAAERAEQRRAYVRDWKRKHRAKERMRHQLTQSVEQGL